MNHSAARNRTARLPTLVLLLSFSVSAQNQNRVPELSGGRNPSGRAGITTMSHPREDRLARGHTFYGDVRTLPQIPPHKFELPERDDPQRMPVPYPGTSPVPQKSPSRGISAFSLSAPAPSPSSSFDGLDFATWGAGHPGDTNGDVGPQHYIQAINTAVGIYRKSDGTNLSAFTFNALMSQGNFGNLCDTNNFGDPVVLYDTFEDRWVISDFAFQLDGSNSVVNPPGEFQCFAVSRSGDPVAGGWNFYSIHVAGGLGDYSKIAIWPDGIYMSANIFGYASGAAFQNVRVWALNKAQMYAGAPWVQVASLDAPAAEFSLVPSNARLQTGTPPAGSPNYFSVVAQFLNAVSVYKFQMDWNSISTATFSGPFQSLTATSWSQFTGASGRVPSPVNSLDALYPRLMMQSQYTNIGGVESLWDSHTVGATGATSSQAAVRYYEVNVTGGTVAANATQAFTFSPDATVHRFLPSVAMDHAGDMAIGYSASSATLNPAIRYAGRLAGDAVNSITQTETSLIEGTGTQSGTCGATCTRWGDYSAMSLDPDGCTFWYTSMYYQATGLSFNTRIGAFSFPSCTPVSTGTLQGTVTATVGGNPMSGVTVALGSRIATSDVNGVYAFSGLASGTYPSILASFPGYNSIGVSGVVVNDGAITTQNFALALAAASQCFTDTTQADFQAGVPSNCDLIGSPGNINLVNVANIDQINTTLSNSGVGITATTWGGETFTPSVTGQLTRIDLNLFCSGCTGTTPNLTLAIRATSVNLPTGADIASATVTGFSSGAGGYFTANFSSPPTLTAGTVYALTIHPTANPSAGIYALTRSATNVYAGGQRVTSPNSGGTWSAPLTTGQTTDIGFKIYMQTGFSSSGTFVSSIKDSNPATGATANWGTLSWTATTPASTAVQFQAAASNNFSGPFDFVGPDHTSGTFFGNGDSLAQFTGKRYLKYQASLSTRDSTISPTLLDVTVCFTDSVATTLAVAVASGPFNGTADLSATLSSSSVGVRVKSINFTLNGTAVGSGTTDGSGTATIPAVSLAGMSAGSYPGAVAASFAGDNGYSASNGSNTLTVSLAAQSITFGALSGETFGDPDFNVTATASSGLTVTFIASGACTVSAAIVHVTGAGSCTITASQTGDTNYGAAPDAPQIFTIAQASQAITFTALSGKTFGNADFTVSATASSGLAVSFSAAGACTMSTVTVHLIGIGTCTVTASQAGDRNYNLATSVAQSFTVSNPDFTVTPLQSTITVQAGQSGTAHISFAPNPETSSATTFACSGLPAMSSCGFAPTAIPAGGTLVDVVMTISTTGPSTTLAHSSSFSAMWLPLSGISFIGILVFGSQRKNWKSTTSSTVLAVMALLLLVACGGHSAALTGNLGTPKGAFPVAVKATSGAVVHFTTLSLVVQ